MRVPSVVGAVITGASLCLGAPLAAQTFTIFDVPGGNRPTPAGISSDGTVAGTYNRFGSTVGAAGFIRDPTGNFTTFLYPGAVSTGVTGISPTGVVFGTISDGRAYIRERDGNFIGVEVPGAYSVQIVAMNAAGISVGVYRLELPGMPYLFIRDADGVITSVVSGLSPNDINARGLITGTYYDTAADRNRGFTLDTQGNFATFDVAGLDLATGTGALGRGISVNAAGVIAGSYRDAHVDPPDLRFLARGFIRDSAGNVTSFEAGIEGHTVPTAINARGSVAGRFGAWSDRGDRFYGFVRDAQGSITLFMPPGSRSTFPTHMNVQGEIVGWFEDADVFQQRVFIRSK